MFIVIYPLFLSVCRLITDQSIKSCRETSPSLMVSAHYSLLLTQENTMCYLFLVPDCTAETLELRRIPTSIK